MLLPSIIMFASKGIKLLTIEVASSIIKNKLSAMPVRPSFVVSGAELQLIHTINYHRFNKCSHLFKYRYLLHFGNKGVEGNPCGKQGESWEPSQDPGKLMGEPRGNPGEARGKAHNPHTPYTPGKALYPLYPRLKKHL